AMLPNRHGLSSLVSALLVVLAWVTISPGPAAAGILTPYATNLVRNPSFETGVASSDGRHPVEIPNWAESDPGVPTVVKYGQSSVFPTVKTANNINGGKKLFSGGPQDSAHACGSITQSIPIIGRNFEIDSGLVRVNVSARLGTYDSQS